MSPGANSSATAAAGTASANGAAARLLVVDDEPDLRTLYELTLLREGYSVDCAGSVAEAWALLSEQPYQLVITDMRLPDGLGLELLARLDAQARAERVIVVTAFASAQNAVEALKAGAYDYLTKPVDLRQFRALVASAMGRAGTPAATLAASPAVAGAAAAGPVGSRSNAPQPGRGASRGDMRGDGRADVQGDGRAKEGDRLPPHEAALQRLVGHSPAMQQVRAMVSKVGKSMAPVLVAGESGTGKELVARAIHSVSARARGPFVAVNCGAIPENLLEAEFFGYRKGAFTGASEDREGFFQAAEGGTLFLDEIGDLPLAMQSKLLRVIQERAVRPLGAVAELPTQVRILSASHKDLGAEVQAGRFRQDLYYRLNVIRIEVPPLRERASDLPQLCAALMQRIASDAGVVTPPSLEPQAMQDLLRYSFPGNVRELENLLHRALALASEQCITRADLGLCEEADAQASEPSLARQLGSAPGLTDGHSPGPNAAVDQQAPGPLPKDLVAYLDLVERQVLERALAEHRNNRTAAGASLNLSLRQMRYRMARLGIQLGDGA